MSQSSRHRYVFGYAAAACFFAVLVLHQLKILTIDEVGLGLLLGIIASLAFALSERLGVSRITAGIFAIENKELIKEALAAIPLDHTGHLGEVMRKNADLFPVIGARVLWVDDNPQDLIPHRQVLRRLGVDVVSAKSTTEAKRQLIDDGDFTLVIQDNLRKSSGEARELVDWLEGEGRQKYHLRMPLIVYSFDQYTDSVGVAEQDWITKDFGLLLGRIAEKIKDWQKLSLDAKTKLP
jgi:CheY-like chemotaxis protein